MRRLITALVSIGLLSCLSGVAAASPAASSGEVARTDAATLSVPLWLHRSWFQWAFGGATAPLLNPDLCGEQVGSIFYLTLAGGVKADDIRHIHCDIPRHVPVLAPIGGVITWSNTQTDQEMHTDVFGSLRNLILHSVHARLDGEEVDHGPLVSPDAYTLSLEPGNLIETVDPSITGDSVRLLDAWYFTLIPPLAPGEHVIVTSDKFDYKHPGVVHYRTQFRVDVT